MSRTEARKSAHLRDVLASVDLAPQLEPRAPAAIERAVKILLERWEAKNAQGNDQRTLETMHAEVSAHWATHRQLEGLPRRTLKRAGWIAFYPPGARKSWLGSQTEFVSAFLEWMKQSRRASALNAIVRAFLQTYPQELDTFERWCAGLRDLAQGIDDGRARKWADRHDRFGLFSTDGIQTFAERTVEAALTNERRLDRHFEDAGLVGLSLSSRFLEMALALALKRVEARLRQEPAQGESELDRLLSIPIGRDGSWRFPQQRALVATTLLRPFVRSDPPEGLLLKIEQFLNHHFKDPRIHPAHWSGVDDSCVAVMKRWLAGKSFDLFFEILARTADRKDHWRERRKFWESYLQRGFIQEAWIILGEDAQRFSQKAVRHQHLAFGALQAGDGAQKSHSVLLMRVVGPQGEAVVTEWSHNGMCRLWYRGKQSQPAFYKPRYGRYDLIRQPSSEISHHLRWQGRLSTELLRHTGIA